MKKIAKNAETESKRNDEGLFKSGAATLFNPVGDPCGCPSLAQVTSGVSSRRRARSCALIPARMDFAREQALGAFCLGVGPNGSPRQPELRFSKRRVHQPHPGLCQTVILCPTCTVWSQRAGGGTAGLHSEVHLPIPPPSPHKLRCPRRQPGHAWTGSGAAGQGEAGLTRPSSQPATRRMATRSRQGWAQHGTILSERPATSASRPGLEQAAEQMGTIGPERTSCLLLFRN